MLIYLCNFCWLGWLNVCVHVRISHFCYVFIFASYVLLVVGHNVPPSPEGSWRTPQKEPCSSWLHSCDPERRCWLFLLHKQGSADEAFTRWGLTDGRQKPSRLCCPWALQVHTHCIITRSTAHAHTPQHRSLYPKSDSEWSSHFPSLK